MNCLSPHFGQATSSRTSSLIEALSISVIALMLAPHLQRQQAMLLIMCRHGADFALSLYLVIAAAIALERDVVPHKRSISGRLSRSRVSNTYRKPKRDDKGNVPSFRDHGNVESRPSFLCSSLFS